ncbi:MAG: Gldg family protein [Candidatus Porifericomitaceae bacterium WSBS_2022_MAG_OTU9]
MVGGIGHWFRSIFNRRALMSGTGLLLAVGLFLFLNIIVNLGLTGVRIDLTDSSLFTLSDGTRNILNKLEEPLHLKLYVSRKPLSEHPLLANYATRVRDMVREYVDIADGKLTLEYIDPEPFSEAEDQAVAEGLRTIPLGGEALQAYFGLVGINSTDDRETIPFFAPEREGSLEYEITKLVFTLNHSKKAVVGVVSSLPMFGEGARPEPWQIINSISEFFDVRNLSESPDLLGGIDVLMLVHPKDLGEEIWYAIDQYLLDGGKLFAFIDPLSDYELANPDPSNEPGIVPDLDSSMQALMAAWGIEMVEAKVVGDINSTMRVQHRGARGLQQVEYLPWMRLDEKNLSQDDFTTSSVRVMHLAAVGELRQLEDKDDGVAVADDDKDVAATATSVSNNIKPKLDPLMFTTNDATILERDLVLFQRNPNTLLTAFRSEDRVINVAVRLSGMARSAFAGPPDLEGEDGGSEVPSGDLSGHIEQGELNAVIVADSDILQDRFWVRIQSLFDIRIPTKIANNGDFVSNTLENLSGNTDLISLRSRGAYARPFTKVEELRREAESDFRDKEQQLKDKLAETEERIKQLQQSDSEEGEAILSARQANEIEGFKQERLETRKKLRAVQHNLNKSIESLGSKMKFINIILVPFGVVVISLLVYLLRRKQRALSWK